MNKKILIIGSSCINQNQIIAIAKKYGMDAKHLEIVTDYKKISHFNFKKLKNSDKYCAVIYGPCPHKCKGCVGYSSPLAMIENEQDCFPYLIRSIANGVLKITKSSFSCALKQLMVRLSHNTSLL